MPMFCFILIIIVLQYFSRVYWHKFKKHHNTTTSTTRKRVRKDFFILLKCHISKCTFFRDEGIGRVRLHTHAIRRRGGTNNGMLPDRKHPIIL